MSAIAVVIQFVGVLREIRPFTRKSLRVLDLEPNKQQGDVKQFFETSKRVAASG